jgi:hypothetical protein
MDEQLQEALLAEALDERRLWDIHPKDTFCEQPRKVWNAVDGWVFVGVQSWAGEDLRYNCYPDHPPRTHPLHDLLDQRKRRDIAELLGNSEA